MPDGDRDHWFAESWDTVPPKSRDPEIPLARGTATARRKHRNGLDVAVNMALGRTIRPWSRVIVYKLILDLPIGRLGVSSRLHNWIVCMQIRDCGDVSSATGQTAGPGW